MNTRETLLHLDRLTVSFKLSRRKTFAAVDDVSFSIGAGEAYGLIGESGSGKTVTALAALGLLDANAIVSGKILWRGENYIGRSDASWRKIRGSGLTMLFQNAQASINPARRIGKQLEAVIKLRQGAHFGKSNQRALELLVAVKMPDPERVMEAYPHEMSGGMAQRAALAMALACQPSLLIADEPTSALDVTIAAQIIELFKQVQREFGLALLIISHDISVIGRLCEKVSVMRTGKIVESGSVADVILRPRQEYTKSLVEASSWQPHMLATAS
jgi:peptide/nickel transport system ATP-binding protein